jgi:hypothetical protein
MLFTKPNKPNSISLLPPDDSLSFFEDFKRASEFYWETVTLNREIYGYQIQPGSKWKTGLSDNELIKFENIVGFSFPASLKNFYKVMNGLDRPCINISGEKPVFESKFYSFTDDLDLIAEMIESIYKRNKISHNEILKSGISRIFPIFAHRFMLIDVPGNPTLSMWGDDIIYWADNVSKLLIKDVFDRLLSATDYKNLTAYQPEIKFWLDEGQN